MPLYTARCPACGSSQSYVRTVANRADTPECCGARTEKVLDAPAVGALGPKRLGIRMPDGAQGGLGTWIEDGAQYQQYMRKRNLIPESEGAAEAAYQRKEKEKADDIRLEKAVEKAVATHS